MHPDNQSTNTILSKVSATQVGLVIVLVTTLAITLSRLVYPYDTGHYEAQIWAPSQLISSGHNPYNLEWAKNPPYVVSVYGPFYYLTIGLGITVFGEQLWVGRLLTDLSVIGVCLCLWTLALRLTSSKRLASLAVIAFVAQFSLQAWVGMQRSDFPALALAMIGLTYPAKALLSEIPDQRLLSSRMIVAGLMFSASALSRQTSFMPILLLIILGLWKRQWRSTVYCAGIFAMTTGITVYLLNVGSDGGFVKQLFLIPASLEKRPDVLLAHLQGLAMAPASWVLFGTLCLSGLTILHRYGFRPNKISAIQMEEELFYLAAVGGYAIVALAIAMLTSSIPGSNVNYYLEAFVFLALFLSLSLKIAGNLKRYGLVCMLLAVSCLPTAARVIRGEYFRWQALPYYQEIVERLGREIDKDQVCFSVYPELAVAANRTYYFSSDVPYDGRSPELRAVYEHVLKSGDLAAIISHSSVAPAGYTRVELARAAPSKFYPVFLHVRNDIYKSNRASSTQNR